jgi:hypothetical protein
MKKLLLAGSAVLALSASAHAAFTPRGIIGDVMAGGGAPTCGQAMQGTTIEPDALLAQFYQICRDNPTWMVIEAVMDQERNNIEAAKKEGAK